MQYEDKLKLEQHTSILDSNNNVKYIVCKAYDITKYRQENQINEQQDVKKRTKDLEEANKNLQKEILERIIIENELRKSEERYRKLIELSPNGIVVHCRGKIIFANMSFTKLLGVSDPKKLIGKSLLDFIHTDYHEMARKHIKHLNMSNDLEFVEEKLIRVDGKVIDVQATGTAFPYEKEGAILEIVQDISDHRDAEKQIEYIAYHDALTDLPNRYLLNEYLKGSLICVNSKEKTIAVAFIDLDRFKIINDTMGHTFGDSVLQQVSKRLVKCVRKDDIISRYGGDEFIVIIEGLNKEAVAKMVQGIIDEFSYPFIINGHEIFISPSIGISLHPNDGKDVETLIKCADLAMYSAKDKGKNNYQFYTSNLSQKISKKMYLEKGLRKALENNEFILHYQPQFDLDTGKIVGAEALIRWQHPEFGLLSPLEFIPLAEEIGLIVPIGKWVLKTACKQNKIWQEAGYPPVHVAVNISACQFQHKNFIQTIKQVLQETKLDPQYLQLEITESIMQNIKELNSVIMELKSIGIQLSIDDFGTGYSSLSILQYLPIDILKIDKSFVDGIRINFNTEAIVKTIVDMGNNLKMNVIAEGIENKEQVLFLKQNKCHVGQGYFFSKPLDVEEIKNVFKECLSVKNDY